MAIRPCRDVNGWLAFEAWDGLAFWALDGMVFLRPLREGFSAGASFSSESSAKCPSGMSLNVPKTGTVLAARGRACKGDIEWTKAGLLDQEGIVDHPSRALAQ